jgi:hypothetical protein
MTITAEHRRPLKTLADASTRGCAEAVLRAHGFDAAMLAELIKAGLVSRTPERVRAGGHLVDIVRLRLLARLIIAIGGRRPLREINDPLRNDQGDRCGR